MHLTFGNGPKAAGGKGGNDPLKANDLRGKGGKDPLQANDPWAGQQIPSAKAAGRMMAQIPWKIAQVIHLDEDHAIIEASTAPTLNRIACRRNDGQVVITHIKAVNSVAIKAFREAKMPFRTTDPEGDDQVISYDIRRAEREHEDAQICR